jgi:hypothetical protein
MQRAVPDPHSGKPLSQAKDKARTIVCRSNLRQTSMSYRMRLDEDTANRLSDWQAKYGHPIYLLETFVQRDCFLGTAYQAANWVRVGQTQGRSRQDQANGAQQQVPIKDIYLYPLHPQFRQRLGATNPSP